LVVRKRLADIDLFDNFHFLDRGFAAYASYLHMEVTYTNPVMLG